MFRKIICLVFFLTVLSCADVEKLDIKPNDDIVVEAPTTSNSPEETPETTECILDLSTVKEGETITINCLLDLEGKTIMLPKNVTLSYDGGEITNGTLNFSNTGQIDGRLLNSSLKIDGDTKLINDNFLFLANKWRIIEGKTIQSIAFNNHLTIQKVIDLVKSMGAKTFSIDKLDAYFETSNGKEANTAAIHLPSDFHLKMSKNTRLRVFPVDEIYSSRLIRIEANSNIKVSGGFLIGDRVDHGPTKGGNVLFVVKGGQDIVIDNVNMSFGSSTGLTVNSVLFPGDNRYVPSKNILINNCVFDSNRANNLSITDGLDVRVENCKLYRAGNEVKGKFGPSLGIAPRIGIVIEPVQGQVVDRVTIKNNTIEESQTNSILAAGGFNIVITGNSADASVGWTTATNVKIIDNPNLNGGIIGGLDLPFALSVSSNNIISGNTVKNANTGVFLTNDDIKMFNNQLIDCRIGIMIRNLKDSEIYDNIITSDKEASFGINGQISANKVIIRDNIVKLSDGRSMNMVGINKEEEFIDHKLTIKGNTFECAKSGIITFSNGFEITKNDFSLAGFGLTNSKNILINDNKIISKSDNAFSINKTESSKNITVTDNTFQNTSSTRLGAYGVRVNTVGTSALSENSNIVFSNNNIKVIGTNYALHVTNFDDVTITGNNIENEELASIYFRGNNSEISNNTASSTDIEGVNNIVN